MPIGRNTISKNMSNSIRMFNQDEFSPFGSGPQFPIEPEFGGKRISSSSTSMYYPSSHIQTTQQARGSPRRKDCRK